MNVAIVGEKGGGGKTTFATNLAGIRASRVGNGRVSLLDTDRQGSSQFWNEERAGHGNGLSQVEVLGSYGESYRRVMSDRNRASLTAWLTYHRETVKSSARRSTRLTVS